MAGTMANIYFPGSTNVIHWLDKVPLSPEQNQTLSTTNVPPTTVDMSGDDPWDWSTDRVVKELCTADRSWKPRGTLTILPTAIDLETKLRDEGIDGCLLLCDVTDEFMKQDLGLIKLAWRVFVKGAFEQLRTRSDKYKQYMLFQHTGSYHTFSTVPAETQHLRPNQNPATPPAHPQQYISIQNYSAATGLPKELEDSQGILTSINSRFARGEFIISDDLGNKRRKLDLTNTASNLVLQHEDKAIYEAEQLEPSEALQASNIVLTSISETPEANGRKRKRIAPTLISSEIDPNRNREIPSAADDIVRNDPQNIEPGVVFIDEDGKKRVIPIHQPNEDSNEAYDYQALLQDSRLSAALEQINDNPPEAAAQAIQKNKGKKSDPLADSQAIGYLGKQKLAVDDIFYRATPIGQDLPDEDSINPTFSVGLKTISSGRRLYMHRVMKKYLKSERTILLRDGKYFSAVLPYPSRLTPIYHQPSFTLFYASEDGKIHARREKLQSWPEIDPRAWAQTKTDVDGNVITFNTSMPGMLSTVGSYDQLNPDSLEKYNYVDGGDEVLPLYGESDEENEYDLETWKEIEKEQGTLDKPLKPLARPLLSVEEVYQAIDEGIAEIVSKWKKCKLPCKEHKAFKLWKKYRPRLMRSERLKKRKLGIEHLNERISKLCKEIAAESWTTKEKVRKQTRMLEPSVYDREDWTWEIRVIENKQPPRRLPPSKALSYASSRRSASRIDDGEEGESIDGQSHTSISDGDLDDFIDDDYPATEEERELNLADGEEDEDGVSTDVSTIGLSPQLPTARKLCFKTSSKRTKSSESNSDDADEPMPDAPFSLSGSETSVPTPVKREETNLRKLSDKPPNSTRSTKMIDLTLSSDDSTPVIDLITPKKKPMLKLFSRNSPINLISDSDDMNQLPDPDNLPPLEATAAIAKYSHQAWVELSDRERLLISVVHGMPVRIRRSIFDLISDDQDELWMHMVEVMDTIRKDGYSVKGMDDAMFECFCFLIRLFTMFTRSRYYPFRERPNKAQVSSLRYEGAQFEHFYLFFQKIEGYFDSRLPLSTQPTPRKSHASDGDDEDDEEPSSGRRSRFRAINTSDDDLEQDTPHKIKRKKKVYENTAARALREQDQERRAAQDERRKNLLASQAKFGDLNNDSQIIINESKLDEQGFIYVNEKIARQIKKHQIDGVRFMWDQLVADENENANQGCLLAHTMGLGKTMQVITLLVAIAEAASSAEESVSSQIPMNLRNSKTLILCPPGLIDNWMDELLIWAPTDSLGSLRKVDATMKVDDRWRIIEEWYNDGGVLILGYEMFRNIIENKKKASRDAPSIDEELHTQIKMQLTEGPNIVIADEAHKLKNANSATSMTTSLFRSRSRIALTGSPLANNVAEYHTMIEWIAPNYLGPAVEFRAKYVEPIQAGLYHDSSAYERRKSLTMLGVLKEDLSPKVHRADMSVLRKDLPPKKEFVITVPLTDLQRKAYSIYVKSMTSNNLQRTKDGNIPQATVWSWLAILSLLCNHPQPFMTKLTERNSEANGGSTPVSREGTTDQEDIDLDLNPSVWKVGVSESLVRDEQTLFAEQGTNIKSVHLSFKTKILCQILDHSKAAGDKTLVFSQSIPTLNFLEEMCQKQGRKYARLDGTTAMGKRQGLMKQFNTGNLELYLISTSAGGLGLNLYGANRVVIFDFKFNPILEEQAVGRAYRIGQQKAVFVYRFVAGGTFEDAVHNKAIFKKQLASRVIDKKKPIAWAKKKSGDFLFEPKDVEQQDLAEFEGMDPAVLDKILASQKKRNTIRAIVQTDTFEKDDDDNLTPDELKQVKQMLQDEKLKRTNPQAYLAMMAQRTRNVATGYPSTLGVTRSDPSSSAPTRYQNPLPSHPQGPQRPLSGPILPPARLKSSPSRAVFQTQVPAGPQRSPQASLEPLMSSQNRTAILPPTKSAQALADRRVPKPSSTGGSTRASPDRPASRSAVIVQIPSAGPSSRASLQESTDNVSRSPIAVGPSPEVGPSRGTRSVMGRGSSPVMGSGTKRGSETSENNSPATTSMRAVKPSTQVTAQSSEKVNSSVDRAVTPQSANRSEILKPRNRDIDTGTITDRDKTTIDSAMLRAMNQRRTVQSLRTPVAKSSTSRKQAVISSLRADEDAQVVQKVLERRARRGGQQSSLTRNSLPSTLSSPTTATRGQRLPPWAVDNIIGAKQGRPRAGRDSSTSSRRTTPKD